MTFFKNCFKLKKKVSFGTLFHLVLGNKHENFKIKRVRFSQNRSRFFLYEKKIKKQKLSTILSSQKQEILYHRFSKPEVRCAKSWLISNKFSFYKKDLEKRRGELKFELFYVKNYLL